MGEARGDRSGYVIMKSVAFCHIPKTAGTSVRAALQSFYDPRRITQGYFIDDQIDNPSPVALEFASGHVPLTFLQQHHQITRAFTVFRDPYDRTYSHFLQLKENPFFRFADDVAKMNFHEVQHHPEIKLILGNCLSKYLGFDYVEGCSQEEFDLSAVGNAEFENALGAIESGDVKVAFADNLDTTLRHVGILPDLYFARKTPILNVHPQKASGAASTRQDPEILELLLRLNSYDIKLYEAAENCLGEQINLRVKTLFPRRDRSDGVESLAILQGAESARDMIATAKDPAPGHSGGIILDFGFEEYIFDSSRMVSYRWVGNAPISYVLFRKSRDYSLLTFDILYSMAHEHFSELELSMNGSPCAFEIRVNDDLSSTILVNLDRAVIGEVSILHLSTREGLYEKEFRSKHSLAIANMRII